MKAGIVRLNITAQDLAQTQESFTSAGSAVPVQAFADYLTIGTQDSFVKANQIRVEPGVSTHLRFPSASGHERSQLSRCRSIADPEKAPGRELL